MVENSIEQSDFLSVNPATLLNFPESEYEQHCWYALKVLSRILKGFVSI